MQIILFSRTCEQMGGFTEKMRSDGRLGKLQAIRRTKGVGCDSATAEPNQQLTTLVHVICAGPVGLSFRVPIRMPIHVILATCSGGQALAKQQGRWRMHPFACDPSVKFSKSVRDWRSGYRNRPLTRELRQRQLAAPPFFGASCFADGMRNARSGGLEALRIVQEGRYALISSPLRENPLSVAEP